MPNFVFWNLNRGGLPRSVGYLALQQNADLVILAECTMSVVDLLLELNAERPDYQFAPGNCEHLLFFTRFNSSFLTPRLESQRVSIRSLDLPARRPLLIAAAHLPSKQNYSDDSQIFESVHLARMIEDVERTDGHQRTILIGDLNMNPFESGMVAASGGLHAVMSRRVAARHTRTVQRQQYSFFYNPMWCHFGDRTPAAGTFYYDSGEPLCYFWNIFDQVLLRPDLLHGFSHDQVRIVTEIAGVPLLKDGCPDKALASDHLPLVLQLDF